MSILYIWNKCWNHLTSYCLPEHCDTLAHLADPEPVGSLQSLIISAFWDLFSRNGERKISPVPRLFLPRWPVLFLISVFSGYNTFWFLSLSVELCVNKHIYTDAHIHLFLVFASVPQCAADWSRGQWGGQRRPDPTPGPAGRNTGFNFAITQMWHKLSFVSLLKTAGCLLRNIQKVLAP